MSDAADQAPQGAPDTSANNDGDAAAPAPAPQRDFTQGAAKSAFDAMVAASKAAASGAPAPAKAPPPGTDADGDDDDDDGVPAPPPAKAVIPAAVAPVVDDPAAAAPVVPEADPLAPTPEIVAAWERVTAQEEDLKARGAAFDADVKTRQDAIAAREAKAQTFGKGLADDPLGAIREGVIAYLGEEASDDDVEAEVADRVSAMSMKLGNLTQDVNDPKVQKRMIDADLRRGRAQKRQMEAEARAAVESAGAAAAAKKTVDMVNTQLTSAPAPGKPTILASCPFLAATPDAADRVVQFVEEHHERTGEILGRKADGGIDLAVAARACEDAIRKAYTNDTRRYAPLLQPTKQTPPPPTAPQGDPPKSRSSVETPPDASRSLETVPVKDPNRPYDPDEHRKATLKLLKQTVAARSREA